MRLETYDADMTPSWPRTARKDQQGPSSGAVPLLQQVVMVESVQSIQERQRINKTWYICSPAASSRSKRLGSPC